MPEFQEYRAIDFQQRTSLVAVHPGDPERLHWNGGMAFMTATEGTHYVTLKRYLVADYASENAIEIQYYHDFPPEPSTPKQSGGWLSPDGVFYPCDYGLHDSLAVRLGAIFYGYLEGAWALEKKHWLRIETTGCLRFAQNSRHKMSQRQLDVLSEILLKSTGEFHKWLATEIELAEVE